MSDGFVAFLDDGTEVSATAVILALPAHAAADAVGAFAGTLAERLEAIPFVSTAVVSVALPRSAVPQPLDGYGFVSPRACGGPLVACTWTSNKFPRRAPDDGVLIRFFLGRAGNDGIVQAPDDEIRGFVRAELRALDIGAEPAHWRIARWPKGIPQYTLGHERRVAAIEREAARHGALILAGASYAGVGIPDCITSGRGAAERALAVMKAAAP